MLNLKKITIIFSIILLLISSTITGQNIEKTSFNSNQISVTINTLEMSVLYEGDIVECEITGEPDRIYWQVNNQSVHTTFIDDNPVLFDPEPTPLDQEYVNLSVHAVKDDTHTFDTIKIQIKRLFFGDIHFHSRISDGYHKLDTLYENAINDSYLDFVCLTDHAEIINSIDLTPPQPIWMRVQSLMQFLMYKLLGRDEWQIIKDKAVEYYKPGEFTTLLGFEYSPSAWYPGGSPLSPNGHFDTCHINFYYRDIYPDAPEYSAWEKYTYDDIFKAMAEENDKGHMNIGFPHHPLMTMGVGGSVSINWSFLANEIENKYERDNVLRGVETYSKWGTAIGKYSDIPVLWPYNKISIDDHPDYWVENALWEWSKNDTKNQKFVLMASSDNHAVDRPGSASMESRVSKNYPNPAGLIAAYSVHNIREEIWDSINNCTIYGTQTLKIRANVKFNDKISLGSWINATSPLKISIAALSTFPGLDNNGKNMHPHGYSPDELDYPISDIWIIKKDNERGRPWCKVINHTQPNTNLAVVNFEDPDVQPNDFYYVAIRQKGQLLEKNYNINDVARDEYMAFLGPVYINTVT